MVDTLPRSRHKCASNTHVQGSIPCQPFYRLKQEGI